MQNVVIIGFGFMGQMHAQIYHLLPQAGIAAIVDERIDASRESVARLNLGDVPVYGSLSDLPGDLAYDIVDICLPTDLHPDIALKAFAAGRHVFCEKPIALTAEDAEAMMAAAEQAEKQLMVGHCIRFWPEYQAFTEFVKSGKAGKLRALSLQRLSGRPGYTQGNWVADEKRCVGAALDMHIHDTDYVHHLLGTPKAVFSRAIHDGTGWNHISTQYLFDGNEIAVTAEGGWMQPANWGFEMNFRALFENGAVDFTTAKDPTLTVTLGDETPEPMPFTNPQTSGGGGGGGNISSLGGYYNELAYFIERLENGQPIDINTGADALASLRTVLAEVESARTGKVVPVGG